MSSERHRAAAKGPVSVQVITVSSTRDEATDTSGKRIVELLEEAGHRVVGRSIIKDDEMDIRAAARGATAQAVIFNGGTGLTARDVTPDAVAPMFTRRLPGFGELFRWLSFQEVGAASMMSRATAGLIGDRLFFLLPGSTPACELAMEKLIVPELAHLAHQVTLEGSQTATAPAEAEVSEEAAEEAAAQADEGPPKPVPSGGLGALGGQAQTLGMSQWTPPEGKKRSDEALEEELSAKGWKRAVYELQGEVVFDRRHELPEELEKVAPILNVLETAGEVGVLVLPSKAEYAVYGWPDLRRPSSKVLAVSWGDPLGEVLALHRFPVMTGTCVEEKRGLLPKAWEDVGRVGEEVCGRAPKDTSGQLFAVQGDAIWILRGSTVFKWDGSKETNDGNPKQALASLMLHWSNR